MPCVFQERDPRLVEITTRGGFVIPANDLTKRIRRPKTVRVESRTPARAAVVSFLSGREVILPSIFHDAIYVGLFLWLEHPYTS